jgi:hypothetical protein
MSSEKTLGEIREAAGRVKEQVSELLTLLSERGFAGNTEIAQIVAEVLSYLRKEDERREQAYMLLEDRAERMIKGIQELMASTEERKALGRELVEERANDMSLRRENFHLQTEHSKLKAENLKLHAENGQLQLENGRLRAANGQMQAMLKDRRQQFE